MINRKNIIITLIALILVVGFGIVIKNSITGPVGYLALQKAPNSMTVYIDGQKQAIKDGEDIAVPVGTHKLKGTRTDFQEKEVTITIKEGKTLDYTLLLDPLNAVGTQYLIDHPDDAALYSAQSSHEVDKAVQSMVERFPMTQVLPMFDPQWRIDYGGSPNHPDDNSMAAIFVYAATPAGRQNALDWMRQQGYDPSDYQIIFEQP
jgi:hypothetical protein